MKNTRRIVMLVLIGALIMLSGCMNGVAVEDYATNEGYSDKNDTSTAEAEKENQSESRMSTAKKGIKADQIKVGVLYMTDPAEGSGYTYTHDLGIQGMQSNLKISNEQVIRKININDEDEEASRQAIQECIDEGCNIIFTTSWGYMNVTEEMAEKYPDIYFSHGTGYLSNGKNFNNYFGRIYQARYLSGIVAGMKTKTNKIGYVAAQDNSSSEVTGGIDAFAMGVDAVNPKAKVYVKITNSWYDPDKEEEASKRLLDMGCDIMAQHCDTPYPQTLAEKAGVWGIGYNSDMSKETPNATLCSVIWNWSAYYTQAVQSVIDGTWDGSNYYGGMAEGLVQITDLADFCADGTLEKVEEAKAKILGGEFNVFDGVIETNIGTTIGSEGTTLDDATITGSINWYFKNVEVID